MDEDLKYGNWTYEEDRQLVVLMAKYGEGSLRHQLKSSE